MNQRTITFYVLKDLETGEIRYVGKTTQTLIRRLQAHVNNPNAHVGCWVSNMHDQGKLPIIEPIDTCLENEDWQTKERFWIKHYRDLGCNLCNKSDGGLGMLGAKKSEASRKLGRLVNIKTLYTKCLSTGREDVYDSASEFSRKYNLSRSAVSSAMRHRGICFGFIVSYTGDFSQSMNLKPYRESITCTDKLGNETVFKSSTQAGRTLGMCPSRIRIVAKSGAPYKGLKFHFTPEMLIAEGVVKSKQHG